MILVVILFVSLFLKKKLVFRGELRVKDSLGNIRVIQGENRGFFFEACYIL